MITILRTSSENHDFITLIKLLDADLAISDGDEHSFYNQFNKIDLIKHVVILYDNGVAVSCGSVKKESLKRMEVKRMYTLTESRNRGFASMILNELESWAREMSYEKCILETGKKQPDAIKLYEKNGYHLIPNYGQYHAVINSLCFEKNLTPK
ncbi:MAG: putative acetyltransferase [Sediminicola sp.]|jgi:GNAT superfamily N-acetyltransferase|tara:strand:+ start:1981 stop:2439 length:459 start_codon:yes stop_codon:yes gene_type:complete